MKQLPEKTYGLVLDAIYNNALQPQALQKSLQNIAKDCNTSVTTVCKVRTVLCSASLLVIEGACRTQRTYWNHAKAKPNASMLSYVYRAIVSKDEEVKVTHTRKRASVSVEAALKTLVKLGYTGVIRRHKQTNGFVNTYEEIDLSKIEVGD